MRNFDALIVCIVFERSIMESLVYGMQRQTAKKYFVALVSFALNSKRNFFIHSAGP
jgi:hypothetical protein